MADLFGTCGVGRPSVDRMAGDVDRIIPVRRFEYEDDPLSVLVSAHEPTPERVAVPGEDGSVLVYGEVYGRERDGGYERRPLGTSIGAYCARAYAEDGIEALIGMNGEFVCIIADRSDRPMRIVTDRLGTVPVYYYRRDGSILFSTSIQALACHSEVETAFEPSYLVEYLARKGVRGVKTPLTGIEQLPPASITALYPETGTIEHERYWQPVYRPVHLPFETFVDLFVDRFTAAVADRIRSDRRHGLLLSGGSDSRLVLATMDSVRAYSFDDGSNDAETATQVARVADVPFRRFGRESDHYRRLLERNARRGNFIGWFNEGRAIGHEATLRGEVEALVSGLYADVLFKGWATPTRELPLVDASIGLPIERRIDDREEYLHTRSGSVPPYVAGQEYKRIRDRNLLESNGGRVRDHGVDYSSFGALARHGFWYPLTNETSFDRYSHRQVLPTVYPFLDRRLIDLSLRMPRRYALRYDLVDRALSRLAPELAAIPHSESGVPLSQPRWKHRLERMRAARPSPGRNASMLRELEWLGAFLQDRESRIRALPLVEYESVLATYREHLSGVDHTAALCGLMTLLEMPVTETLTRDGVGLRYDEPVAASR